MKLVTNKGKEIKVYSGHKPAFKNTKERSWDGSINKVNGVDTSFHYDSTFGKWIYFYYGHWYKINIHKGYDDILEGGKSNLKFIKRS